MIRQYLSNTNESATVSISQKILELNKYQIFFKINTILISFVFDKII
jgi:hypothetical protein